MGCKGSMEVQARAPVVKVPVLSKAMVLHRTSASSTFPPCINIPLQQSHLYFGRTQPESCMIAWATTQGRLLGTAHSALNGKTCLCTTCNTHLVALFMRHDWTQQGGVVLRLSRTLHMYRMMQGFLQASMLSAAHACWVHVL